MIFFKFSNVKLYRQLIAVLSIALGVFASGSAFSTTMTVTPASKTKINSPIMVNIKFDGLVETLSGMYPVCPPRQLSCTVLGKTIKILDKDKVVVKMFYGPLACTGMPTYTIRGINYYSCSNVAVSFELPAKSEAGTYRYTVVRDVDMFAQSFSTTFDVRIGNDAGISAILPILLD